MTCRTLSQAILDLVEYRLQNFRDELEHYSLTSIEIHWRARGVVRSDLRQTTIDEQFNPGDKAAVIGGQEQSGFGNLVRLAHPT